MVRGYDANKYYVGKQFTKIRGGQNMSSKLAAH